MIHFPPNFDSADELPLVFNLHGYTSNAAQQALYSQMNDVSDDGNFIVCYPDGIDNSWNVGLPGGSSADDVGFLGDLIDSLHALYNNPFVNCTNELAGSNLRRSCKNKYANLATRTEYPCCKIKINNSLIRLLATPLLLSPLPIERVLMSPTHNPGRYT